MAFPFFGNAQQLISQRVEKLRSAEARLIQYAKQFGNRNPQEYEIKAIDTNIGHSTVPLKAHNFDIHGFPDEYIIHSIKVESKSNNNDDSSKTPLVILHGYMNGGIYFYRNLVGLSRYFSTIHSLDLLGWGLSSRPKYELAKNNSLDAVEDFYVESIEAWRQKNNVDKMILAGHSMGGYFSVAYSEKYPQHVERLILLSPVGVPKADPEKFARQEKMITSTLRGKVMWNFFNYGFPRYTVGEVFRSLPEGVSKNFFTNYMERRVPAIVNRGERDAVVDYLHYNTILPGSGEYCLNKFLNVNVVAHKPLIERVPKLDVSHVSFIYGDNDWMDYTGGMKVLQAVAEVDHSQSQKTPETRLFKVSQAGHLLMLDNWQGLNAGIVLAAGLRPTTVDKDFVPQELRHSKQ